MASTSIGRIGDRFIGDVALGDLKLVILVPTSTSATGWTNEGGAPDFATALGDANVLTLARSSTTSALLTVDLEAPQGLPPAGPWTLLIGNQSTGGTSTYDVVIKQGATTIATRTGLTATGTLATTGITLSVSEVAAIPSKTSPLTIEITNTTV